MSITLWQYYKNLGSFICDRAFDGIDTLETWNSQRAKIYKQFMSSMSLDPLPPKCDLKETCHGELKGKGFRMKKVSFQILPDCWATSAIYYPDPLPAGKLPGVLYVSGHNSIGVHGYQTQGMLWALRGYVCMVLDTIEQHDNPGQHHGIFYRIDYGWISHGYSGAGGELWNSIRALDLLASLPEVDANRLGTTGNSGGGALSFFLGIADERIKAVATSCGAAAYKETLANRHILGHCDCIYYHNLFQRYPSEFGALMAPRPLAYVFGRLDYLFSPEENKTLHAQTQKIYKLMGCEEACQIFTHGLGHGYQPESISFINQWFDRHVAGKSSPDVQLPQMVFSEKETTLFNGRLPKPNHLDLLPQLLSSCGSVELPTNLDEWKTIRTQTIARLKEELFSGPTQLKENLKMTKLGEWISGSYRNIKFEGEIAGMEVWMEILIPPNPSGKVLMAVMGSERESRQLVYQMVEASQGHILVYIEPRGSRYTAPSAEYERDFLRAGALTGATPVMLAINDILKCHHFLQSLEQTQGMPVYLYGIGDMGVASIYATLFDESIAGVVAQSIPATHRSGAYIPGILRHFDIDQAMGLVAPRPLSLVNMNWSSKRWTTRLYERLGISKRFFHSEQSFDSALKNVLNAS